MAQPSRTSAVNAPQNKVINWSPQPGPQYSFFECPAFELLYGGAAGGGKSEALVFQSISLCIQHPSYRAILFRRTFPELEKSLIPRISAILTGFAHSRDGGKEWTFPNKSVLYLSHLQREEDKEKYKSAEFDYIGFDELTSFSETQYLYLFSRCRGTTTAPKMVRSASNSTGSGHAWVKHRFVQPEIDLLKVKGRVKYQYACGWQLPDGRVLGSFDEIPDNFNQGSTVFREEHYNVYEERKSGLTRSFLPALLWANQALIKSDPDYAKRLKALDKKTQDALLYGSWDILEGQFFAEWNPDFHVVQPFEIPPHWRKFVGIDYGFSAPFCAIWFAVDENGIVYLYRELYERRFTTEEQSSNIIELTKDEKIDWYACDPSMFAKQGTGESHAQVYQRHGVPVIPASNKRIPRWAMMHEYLKNNQIKVFDTCSNFIRTLPTLMHSRTNPDDLDSAQEDHACLSGDTLIDTSKGQFKIKELVGKQGFVHSLGGLERFSKVRKTRESASIVKLKFSDGRQIKCTPDHRFLTNDGWIRADGLVQGFHILIQSSIWTQQSSQKQSKNFKAADFIFAENIFKRKVYDFISLFSKRTVVRLQKAFTFTIKITTEVITHLATLNFSRLFSTFQNIKHQSNAKLPDNGCYLMSYHSRKLGMQLMKVLSGIVRMVKKLGKKESGILFLVRYAVKKERHHFRREQSSVVRLVTRELGENEDVYNMEVENTHCFSVEGGLLAHNCDAFSYGLITLRGYASSGPRPQSDNAPQWFRERIKPRQKLIQRISL